MATRNGSKAKTKSQKRNRSIGVKGKLGSISTNGSRVRGSLRLGPGVTLRTDKSVEEIVRGIASLTK
jgi:hypothetical protein